MRMRFFAGHKPACAPFYRRSAAVTGQLSCLLSRYRACTDDPAAWRRCDRLTSQERKSYFFRVLLSLCLFRACLGKIIVCMYNWLKKGRFSHRMIIDSRFCV